MNYDLLYYYKIQAHKIYDGDTITKFSLDYGFGLTKDNRKDKGKGVRLYGINTPEMRGESLENARLSKNFLSAFILNQWVVVQSIKDSTGKYGRYLFVIYLTEEQLKRGCEILDIEVPNYEVDAVVGGINLNQLIVREGFGVEAHY